MWEKAKYRKACKLEKLDEENQQIEELQEELKRIEAKMHRREPTEKFGMEQISRFCKAQGSASKFVDCLLCIAPVVQMLEQRFHKHFWGQFTEQLEKAQQQSAEMQQTAKQSTTQNPEAMLFRMVRAQQDVVNVSDGLVPPGGAGTRSGLKSPVLKSGPPTSPLGQRLAPPTPHVPLGGRTPPSAGMRNLSTESTGTGCERVR